jgi:hypothetical protein
LLRVEQEAAEGVTHGLLLILLAALRFHREPLILEVAVAVVQEEQ